MYSEIQLKWHCSFQPITMCYILLASIVNGSVLNTIYVIVTMGQLREWALFVRVYHAHLALYWSIIIGLIRYFIDDGN